ncbi:MAG: RagB/SusD family nutrient uptake outer membrane protein [Prevotellaceae bacterium]|nr:RagB/SusD family nutrient uptake outer membrane protein [Prevotellaceae bacterium]
MKNFIYQVNKLVNHLKKTSCQGFKMLLLFPLAGFGAFLSCDYLDVVPDNIPTIEHAFRNRVEAQNYKYGCFSFMPDVGNMAQDPAMLGCDEIWVPELIAGADINVAQLKGIITGNQGTNAPLANYWVSQRNSQTNVAKALWTGISDCNIFLENIYEPFDLEDSERNKWRGEIIFLKAYLHYWLFRQYGPVPLMKNNKSIDSPSDEVQQYREPVDSCVNYIASLLDEAAALLPLTVEDPSSELGFPDKCIALALKAELLTLAASPLFNCNPDYADYGDNRGVQLFPQDRSQEQAKWQRAAEALKMAIDVSHEGLHALYDFPVDYPSAASLSRETILSMQVRGAFTIPWNPEIIWGNSRHNNGGLLQRMSSPYFTSYHSSGSGGLRNYSPTLNIVEQFYTKNGLPIEDDAEWAGKNLWSIRTATESERQNIRQGYKTIELHFDREQRFYGAISFDGETYFGNSRITQDNTTNAGYMWVTEMKNGQLNGWGSTDRSSLTGYIAKKMVHFRNSMGDNAVDGYVTNYYAFPIIRLAGLYLLYAEALNEVKDAPDAEVYEYIDRVRERTGLEGVVETWSEYAVADKKNKPLTKEGMRDIIRRERINELAFEGARFWDMRRWKMAKEYMNRPIRGLNVMGSTDDDFYQETVLFEPKFELKDYFFPLRANTFLYNINLLQSPGW